MSELLVTQSEYIAPTLPHIGSLAFLDKRLFRHLHLGSFTNNSLSKENLGHLYNHPPLKPASTNPDTMAPISSIAAASLLFLGSVQAHFLLLSPAPVGTFDEDNEGTGPCGGYTPDFSTDNITDFAVGGDAIATQLGHPQAQWLYRITTDETASGNWTQIYPIVQQSGLKFFCVPTITVPESYVGQTAVLSVVADAPDGLLYQVCSVLEM